MVALEATVAVPNGRVNGYHSGPGLESVIVPGVEPLDGFPVVPQQLCNDVAAPKSTPQGEPRGPANEAKATREKMPRQANRPARKGSTNAAKKANLDSPRIRYAPQALLDAELAELEQLSREALDGDTVALDRLRAALDDAPHVWQRLADLQLTVEMKLINLVAGDDPLRAEAFRKRVSELRCEILDGQPASLATKMAASRAVACWMFTQLLELRALESPNELRNIKSLEQGERRLQIALRTFRISQQADVQLERLNQQT